MKALVNPGAHPSSNELRRDVSADERRNRLDPEDEHRKPYVTQCLGVRQGPVVAASD